MFQKWDKKKLFGKIRSYIYKTLFFVAHSLFASNISSWYNRHSAHITASYRLVCLEQGSNEHIPRKMKLLVVHPWLERSMRGPLIHYASINSLLSLTTILHQPSLRNQNFSFHRMYTLSWLGLMCQSYHSTGQYEYKPSLFILDFIFEIRQYF